jgi:hypothetical protein
MGLVKIPIVAHTKKPAVPWAEFQKTPPTPEQTADWESAGYTSWATICGRVSDNLVVVDFDDLEMLGHFWKSLPEDLAFLKHTRQVKTPSGGLHIYLQVPDDCVAGNQRLAFTKDRSVAIETRGEGGYVVCPPSPNYILKNEPILPISGESWKALVEYIGSLSHWHHVPKSVEWKESEEEESDRPGDLYNSADDALDKTRNLLMEAGWTSLGVMHNGLEGWCRPGKSGSLSATLGLHGMLFYVFSSNADPFEADKGYTPFTVLTLLKFGGDFKAAARSLTGDPEVLVRPDQPWERIIPLDAQAVDPFPISIIPETYQNMMEAVSVSTQTPIDMAGILGITVPAAVLAKTVAVAVREDWTEPVNLFSFVAAPPGSRKSAVFSHMTRPLYDWEAESIRIHSNEIKLAKQELRSVEQKIEGTIKEMAKAGEEMAPELRCKLEKLNTEQERISEILRQEVRLLADDVTPEKLAQLMAQHNGKMAVFSADTNIFEMMLGRYSGETNLDVYLKSHSGDPIRVDRVGRDSDIIRNPALTMAFTVQPDVLQGLMRKPALRGRGMLGRIWYCLPTDGIGYREFHTPPVPTHVSQAYKVSLQSMLSLKPVVTQSGAVVPNLLHLTEDAAAYFWDRALSIEHRQRPGGDLSMMTDWASKLHGLVARFAAILHVMNDEEICRPIRLTTMVSAWTLGNYAVSHAKKAFIEMGSDTTLIEARAILSWIRKEGRGEFSRRDINRFLPSIFPKAESPDLALKMLSDRGYIREIASKKNSAGRKPSPKFEVHPGVLND